MKPSPAEIDAFISEAIRRGGTVSPPRGARGLLPVCVTIPIKLPSLANCRWHWARMAREKKKQAEAVEAAFVGVDLPALPVVVKIVRVGPRRLDGDNATISAKAVRDAIARLYGRDDADECFAWEVEQRTGKYGVEVRITRREGSYAD